MIGKENAAECIDLRCTAPNCVAIREIPCSQQGCPLRLGPANLPSSETCDIHSTGLKCATSAELGRRRPQVGCCSHYLLLLLQQQQLNCCFLHLQPYYHLFTKWPFVVPCNMHRSSNTVLSRRSPSSCSEEIVCLLWKTNTCVSFYWGEFSGDLVWRELMSSVATRSSGKRGLPTYPLRIL